MALKTGDMVMLVWACCAMGRKELGWTGAIEGLYTGKSATCACGIATEGQHAYITIGDRGVVPLSWLKKIEPPEQTDDVTKDQEITA